MGEAAGVQKQKLLPIIRSGNGKFFGFGESEAPDVNEMKGRFAQLVSTRISDADMRDLAKRPKASDGLCPARFLKPQVHGAIAGLNKSRISGGVSEPLTYMNIEAALKNLDNPIQFFEEDLLQRRGLEKTFAELARKFVGSLAGLFGSSRC